MSRALALSFGLILPFPGFLKIPFLGDSNKPNKSSLCKLDNIVFETSENDAHNKLVLLK
jgi:hypothetical protein